MTAVQVRGLVKTFGSLVAVHELEMNIETGALHALLGPTVALDLDSQ